MAFFRIRFPCSGRSESVFDAGLADLIEQFKSIPDAVVLEETSGYEPPCAGRSHGPAELSLSTARERAGAHRLCDAREVSRHG
ncbi:hypothetical protein N1F89_12835 [Aquibium sp. A9E412]|uniref:hypothetical protein n=1 Tax=Aquibium sp. A9E412 TaxID=2976767 RepID=UPI0025B14918|nr:hypothetical protein [Aquibium sp. A9E412]MDN2567108.1 hypothetical protein [Aquibium sp. A9E412]